MGSPQERTSDGNPVDANIDIIRAAVEHAFDSVTVTTAQLDEPGPQILYVNPAFTRMTGYSAEEVIGKTPRLLQGPKTDRGTLDRLRKSLSEGKPFVGEAFNYRKDGSEFVLEWRIDGVRDRQGVIRYWVAIQRDITKRKQAERALEKSLVEVRQSNRDLEQFAHVVAHDLREPLRGVIAFSALLQKRCKGEFDDEAEEHLELIVQSATRMQHLIDDLLSYARLTAKTKPHEPADCETALVEAVANLKLQIEESEATVAHTPLPTVVGDATQLMQLFQNLVANAIKYRGENPAEVHVSAEQTDGGWQFCVRDNGIGIPPEQHDKIFKLFQRIRSTEDEYTGTGIGLAVCKRIVEQHGGRIWVDSEACGGSIFYFTLPSADPNNMSTDELLT